jgi:hypothetical protein
MVYTLRIDPFQKRTYAAIMCTVRDLMVGEDRMILKRRLCQPQSAVRDIQRFNKNWYSIERVLGVLAPGILRNGLFPIHAPPLQ